MFLTKKAKKSYINFCQKLGLITKEKYPHKDILNREKIAGCITVNEQIINLVKLKQK